MDINETLKRAIESHNRREFSLARDLYAAILETTPDHPYANHNLGDLLIHTQSAELALPYFVAALNADPTSRQFWLSYIKALCLSGKAQEASEVLGFAKQHGLSGSDVNGLEIDLRDLIENETSANECEPTGRSDFQNIAPVQSHLHDATRPEDHSKVNKQYFCPVCDSNQERFLPLPESYREQARIHGYQHYGQGEMISIYSYSCSRCGASDRERIYSLWIDQQLANGGLGKDQRVIHFAPEPALSRRLRTLECFDYRTADMLMEGVDYRIDIMNMPFPDNSFDFFICSHVLEHVDSDDLALKELFRITNNGGLGILVAPICLALSETLEDPSVTNESERWRLFGQGDHVRLYAHDDFTRKIRKYGFSLDELGVSHFGESVFESLGLKSTSILYIARKVLGNPT